MCGWRFSYLNDLYEVEKPDPDGGVSEGMDGKHEFF